MRKLVNYLLSASKIFKEFFADYTSYMNYSMMAKMYLQQN